MTAEKPLTAEEIQAEVQAIVRRNQEKINYIRRMPVQLRSTLDLTVFKDMAYLLRYIVALQRLIQDVAPAEGPKFEFSTEQDIQLSSGAERH